MLEEKKADEKLSDQNTPKTKIALEILRLLEKKQTSDEYASEKELISRLNIERKELEKILEHMEGMGLVEKTTRTKITKFGFDLLKN